MASAQERQDQEAALLILEGGEAPQVPCSDERNNNTLTGRWRALATAAAGILLVGCALVAVHSAPSKTEQEPREVRVADAVGFSEVLNRGLDCWKPCGKKGGKCDWCGMGNLCCRKDVAEPGECAKAKHFLTYHHECVSGGDSCHDAQEGESCYEEALWAKEKGITRNPHWYPGLTKHSDILEFQQIVYNAGDGRCPKPCFGKAPTVECLPGEVATAAGDCVKADRPAEMKFYLYRSRSDETYATENANAGNLGGVLWYLHNEVVVTCPRKFAITRIERYLLTVKNTQDLWNRYQSQFSQFVAFDRAKCTVPDCQHKWWDTYGYTVGCSPNSQEVAAYTNPVWFSLPGRCPSQEYSNKSDACVAANPGGQCRHPDGTRDCTWSIEDRGEIDLNELVGIPDQEAWCEDHIEYEFSEDGGKGTDFWKGKRDKGRCDWRKAAVTNAFHEKYPQWPANLPEPQCDFWR